MPVNELSPVNQKIIETKQITSNQQVQVDLTTKPDTVELTSKIKDKKKRGKYIAFAALGVAILAGSAIIVASLVKKGNLLGAKNVQDYADKIQSQAEKLKEEVVELFNNKGMKDGNLVAKITSQDDGIELMEEFAQDGSLLRKSEFIDNILSSVEVSAKKGCNRFEFKDGKLLGYAKGFEELADGSLKAVKVLDFENGKLSRYLKGFEVFADGSKKAVKVLDFENGKLSGYAKGYEKLADGSEKIAKGLDFVNGKLSGYGKGYEMLADGSEKAAKRLVFEDGKLSEYVKGFEELADGSKKAAKRLVFEDGKLSEYVKGFEELADGSKKIAKTLYFEDGKLLGYAKGYEELADGSVKTAKRLDFEEGKPFQNIIKFVKSYFKKD